MSCLPTFFLVSEATGRVMDPHLRRLVLLAQLRQPRQPKNFL